MKKIMISMLVALLGGGCSSETLQLQTEFPFTLSSETLPASVKVGRTFPFQVTITPERMSTQTHYALRFRPLSDSTGQITVDGVELLPNRDQALKSLKPLVRFTAPGATTYQFSLVVTDQSGSSQELPVSIQAN